MTPAIARSANAADYGLLLLLAAIWGASFLLVKIGVGDVPPLTLTALRLLFASLLLIVLARLAGQSVQADRSTWGLIIITALSGNALPFLLISWGQARIDSGLAAILMAVMPLVTYLLAHVFTPDERLNRWKAAGVVLGLAGIVVLIGPAKLMTLGQETVRQLAVAAAAVCYSVNALLVRRLAGFPPLALVAVFMTVSFAALAPLSLMFDRPWALTPGVASLTAIVLLGLLQTALGTVLMMVIVRRQGASFFSLINFLVPLLGVGWGMLVLSERPTPDAVLALAMVLGGIALARHGARQGAPEAKG